MGITLEIGAEAERAAVAWLRERGFLIMDTNWRSGRDELDIVASRGDTVHFVEVKCRKAGGLTSPEEAITPAKAKNLLRAANAYISAHGIESYCSVDLIAADLMPDGSIDIRYVPGAVQPRW